MDDLAKLALLDSPEICRFLFHPRSQGDIQPPQGAKDRLIKAYDGTNLGARFYLTEDPENPIILFFHGNGEIAADYDQIGLIYNAMNMSFIAVDYRGYGKSQGTPSVSFMLQDAHAIYGEVRRFLDKEHRNGELWIMGRSLGSACALEVSSTRQEEIAGMIIESGFAWTKPLLDRLGIDTENLPMNKSDDPIGNLTKIQKCHCPTLVIHAQLDHIIDFYQGQALYQSCPAKRKYLHVVEGANHNNIFLEGGRAYFETIKLFVAKALGSQRQ